MKKYSYQTFPGQTIIHVVEDGYTKSELLDELVMNGEGKIISDDENTPFTGMTIDQLRKSSAARTLGSIRTEKKAVSSRVNGKKGGRPRGTETYTVTMNPFHGGRELYSGRSLAEAVRIARKHSCGECKCGGPQIIRSDGAAYLNWEAAKPFSPANEPFWITPDCF